MARMEAIWEATQNIQYLSFDVNINEICGNIATNSLENWLSAWQNAMDKEIKKIKEALFNE